MNERPSTSYERAVRDFRRARKTAVLRQALARLRGQNYALLDYDTVRETLKLTQLPIARGLQEIELSKIVGSVGRNNDFTRDFLPLQASDESRWANIRAAMDTMVGMPPIEVYQIGETYFVLDGNHRVSVARKLGAETISAYVTEIETRVPFRAGDDLDRLICKTRRADFLARTKLNLSNPEEDFKMTSCGHYRTLLEQIEQHFKNVGEDSGEPATFADAAKSWYEARYLPVIKIVRELGVMRRFPGRTETDIYVLLSERRQELETALGWELDPVESLPGLVESDTNRPGYVARILDSLVPELVEDVQVGSWRKQQLAMHRQQRLFSNLLVLFEGIEEDWQLLDSAVNMALADHDRLLAFHVVATPERLNDPDILEMQARFHSRCKEAGLVGEFAVETGNAISAILRRIAWSDLVFVNLTDPPESTVRDRLRSFWGPIITRSPRPLLIAPHAKYSGMSPMLLAYDGSRKANEALFIAAYQASRWKGKLTVLSVETAHTSPVALAQARQYLEERGVDNATYLLREGEIGKLVIETAREQQCNLIIMGGFGAGPAIRLLRGSSIEYVLQHATQSIMICQ